jgi:hypothetical protein
MGTTNTVSPLRQRMIEDMTARNLGRHSQRLGASRTPAVGVRRYRRHPGVRETCTTAVIRRNGLTSCDHAESGRTNWRPLRARNAPIPT